ncbi:MAG: competence/damage-inducible protein A [Oscillospiraceae bacterium]
MRAEIISVGTELLLGDIVNTNAQFLAQQLASLGFEVFYQTVVGDNPARLRQLVMEAKARSDVLVFTGGLGPTDDDLTKETVAEAYGDVLVMDNDELAHLQSFFSARGAVMTDNNRKQAMVPMRGRKLPNANGTAPGAYFRQGGKYAFLLPGPPREMKPLFLEQVAPILETLQDSAIRSVTLRTFGVGESELEDRIRPLLAGSNPTAALYAKTSEVHIRITAKGPTAEQADLMCDQYAQLFREALGDLIYSENGDNLEKTVVKLLLNKGQGLATAESCTGGLLGERITSVPGASGVYGFGAITYANAAKHEMLGVRSSTLRKYGAVSSQVAAEMAFGAAKRGLADYGVATTGIAGPDGGTAEKPVGLVYIALAHGREVFIRRLRIRHRGRTFVRNLAAQNALDMVRRAVLGLPLPHTKRFTQGQEADYERVGRPRRKNGALVRGILAVLAVILAFALVLAGITYGRRSAPPGGDEPAGTGLPSAEGLRYGSVEYTTAACALVAEAAEQNPSVVGFVALPDNAVEALVGQASFAGQADLAAVGDEAGLQDLVAMGADASPAQATSNTVLLGGAAFAPLLDYPASPADAPLTTFTYYTSRQARVYQVCALFVADDGEARSDGFDPLQPTLPTTGDFLQFMLGAKARSFCHASVDLALGDSFMTLAVDDTTVPGRRVYLCGRLARQGENPQGNVVAPATAPLMPAAYYAQHGLTAPDEPALLASWMRWYLSREATNQGLQLATGMPGQDAVPTVPRAVPQAGESTAAPRRTSAHQLTVTMNGQRTTDTPLSILAQICQAEAAGQSAETIRAVAVAAHSWILNQQGAGIEAPAVVGMAPSAAVLSAVRDVADLVLSADGETPAFAPFHRMAAYATNAPADVWGGERSYLSSVASPYEQGQEGWRQILTVEAEPMFEALAGRLALELDADAPEGWFGALTKNEAGYVQQLEIAGSKVSGLDFWARVLTDEAGAPLLQSPAFEVEYNGGQFVFIVYGSGHGCGLSIAGAAGYAKEGWDHARILAHYYPGTNLIAWE